VAAQEFVDLKRRTRLVEHPFGPPRSDEHDLLRLAKVGVVGQMHGQAPPADRRSGAVLKRPKGQQQDAADEIRQHVFERGGQCETGQPQAGEYRFGRKAERVRRDDQPQRPDRVVRHLLDEIRHRPVFDEAVRDRAHGTPHTIAASSQKRPMTSSAASVRGTTAMADSSSRENAASADPRVSATSGDHAEPRRSAARNSSLSRVSAQWRARASSEVRLSWLSLSVTVSTGTPGTLITRARASPGAAST